MLKNNYSKFGYNAVVKEDNYVKNKNNNIIQYRCMHD